jgi:hypothetical protein
MAQVITYRLAYLNRSVNLCSACVDRGNHGCGSLGPVQHGMHSGDCDGARHGEPLTIAERVAARLVEAHPLRAVLQQTSGAYGSVAGKLDTLAGFIVHGQESEPQGRQAFAELVDAIHAPRAEAQLLAAELHRMVRAVTWDGEVTP